MLDRLFQLSRRGATVRTEVIGGATTFLTMAYIVVVNPAILAGAGMPVAATAAATCVAAAFGSILMGLASNYPLALAPGMGLNAYFAYVVVQGMGLPWPTALGCVFLSALGFLALTLTGARRMILHAIPPSLLAATAGGIGLFIAFVGLKQAGIVVSSPATLVTLGRLDTPNVALAGAGLLATGLLQARRAPGAILVGAATAAALGWALHLSPNPPAHGPQALWSTVLRLDIGSALRLRGGPGGALLEVMFVFLFVDLFDNVGTLSAVTGQIAGVGSGREIAGLSRVLLADALAAVAGALVGVSTVTSYVESAAGVAAGARTGLASVVVGMLFLAVLPLAPWVGAIPSAATAPALIIVGAMMLGAVAALDWSDPAVGLPAFLTLVAIPLTFSIANGLAIGLVAHAAFLLALGRARRSDAVVLLLAALCVARFVYAAQS